MNTALSTRTGLAQVNCNKAWLSRKLKVTPQYVGAVCNGKTTPSTEMIEKLANAFEVEVSVYIKWGEL